MAACLEKRLLLYDLMLCCFRPFSPLFVAVCLEHLADILLLLYLQGDVGLPGPPGPVSTIKWGKPTLHRIDHYQQVEVLFKGSKSC